MSSSLIQLAGLLGLFSLAFLTLRRIRCQQSLPLPPGPRGLPLIGNILDIPKGQEWVTFNAISQEYDSDIIHLNMAGTPTIIVNSLEAVRELFDKRSTIYSGRPPMTMVRDLVGFTWNFAMMPYGEYWKEHRKLFHKELETVAYRIYRPRELEASRYMLLQLLEHPSRFREHLRHMAGRIILSTAYGIDVKPDNDPYVAIGEASLQAIAEAGSFGAFLVDCFPFLQYIPDFFPGAAFKRRAKEWRKTVTAIREVPYQFVKDSLAAGDDVSSIASRILDTFIDDEDAPQREGILKNVLATMYLGGADTTVSSMTTFILAMVQNPDIQRKAQAAVDEVIGRDRLPDFSDRDSIPFVDAIVKEALRWRPVIPLALPHAASTDDTYRGYHIPAGSVIIGNAWALLNDESMYGPDTDKFNPERWLKDGKINPSVKDPDFAFGFGRRICPGKDMAQSSIWITVVSILSAFDIQKAVDGDGRMIEPSGDYTSGLLCYPTPFQCSIRPRSTVIEALIRADTPAA